MAEEVAKDNAGLSVAKREPVIGIPEENLRFDPDSPVVAINGLTPEEMSQVYPKQILPDSKKGNGFHSRSTRYSGRAVFSSPGYLLTTADDKRSFSCVQTVSVGVPRAVREGWGETYAGKTTFFFSPEDQKDDHERLILIGRSTFFGLKTKEDQQLDAKASIRIHNLGIKTRIPLCGWFVDSFDDTDKEGKTVSRDIAWFKEQGFGGDELYQSAWGLSCPLRLEDVCDFLKGVTKVKQERAVDERGATYLRPTADVDLKSLNCFIGDLFTMARGDNSPEYKALLSKWQNKVESGQMLSQRECADVFEDFCLALCTTMGRNYHLMFVNGIHHSNLSDQNITFFGEICDNSTVADGLMRIGRKDFSPEDMIEFVEFLRYCSRTIFYLRGQDPNIRYQHEGDSDYLDQVLFAAVRGSWLSYRQYCETLYQEDLKQATTPIGVWKHWPFGQIAE